MEQVSIYSDESGTHGSERFQAIGAFSGEKQSLVELEKVVVDVQTTYNVSNVSYKNINTSHDTQNAMKEIISAFLGQCDGASIRLDIITWDTHDRRHDVRFRDDTENLKRMYYHLLAQIIYHWRVPKLIGFYPDEKTSFDWEEDVQKFISSARGIAINQYHTQTIGGAIRDRKISFTKDSCEVDDDNEPLVQGADLMAGLARKTYSEGDELRRWMKASGGRQQTMSFNKKESPGKNKAARFKLMKHFYDVAKKNKFGLSFKENNRFQTNKYHQNKPLNVWKFVHVEGHNKAPTK